MQREGEVADMSMANTHQILSSGMVQWSPTLPPNDEDIPLGLQNSSIQFTVNILYCKICKILYFVVALHISLLLAQITELLFSLLGLFL